MSLFGMELELTNTVDYFMSSISEQSLVGLILQKQIIIIILENYTANSTFRKTSVIIIQFV